MAINFPNSPANGATHTAAGTTFTYDATAGVWNPAGTGNAAITTNGSTPSLAPGITATEVRTLIGAGTTAAKTAVYATVDALPTSGNSQGDLAHVTANNTLYFWNGSGWYKIALINTNPSISGVASAYTLATDGTATTVTITATDPEGLPITYSIASDTSGNTAAVSQGTGASTNVFTITPSTNTAHAGSFTLTFRASDGVNLATAPATFTLQFKVQNSKYTTALITSVGANNAVNTAFDDKSTLNHTITVAGDAHQTTFSPYRHGGYSAFFDGTNDYLSLAGSSDFAFGTGAFTIEFWMWCNDSVANGVYNRLFANDGPTGDSAGNLQINLHTSGGQIIVWSGSSTLITGSTNVCDGEWHHIAVTRSGTSLKVYVDGTQDGTATDSTDWGTHNSGQPRVYIGRGSSTGWYPGYLTDYRIIKGTALYTSNFTAPTERLTAVTNTKLLTCHLPYFADGSTSAHSITVTGTIVEPFAPYDAAEYTNSSHGGSAHFDSSGDSLNLNNVAALGSGTFTLEYWIYAENNNCPIFDYRPASTNGNYPTGWITTGSQLMYYTNSTTRITSTDFSLNVWHHVAYVRDSSNVVKIYIDGVAQSQTYTDTATHLTASNKPQFGDSWDGGNDFKGNLTDLRITNTAVYTSNFTPPTEPLTAISGTQFLLSAIDAGIIDKSQTADFVSLNGGTKSSTTYTKYLSSSMYFDGVDDTITVPQIDIKAGQDFTIECWHYLTSRTDSYPALFGNYSTWGTGGLGLFADHSSYSGGYQVAHNGTFPFLNIGTVTYNQWVHVALVRNGSTMTLYVNGTSAGSGNSGSVALPGVGTSFMIGRSSDNADGHIQGYLSDFRVTIGLARYTSNFTAPTAALQG